MPLEIEDKINVALVINESVKYKKWPLFMSTYRSNICKKVLHFCFLLKIGVKI